jgi:polar amino acid transport system permease protein
VFSVAVILQNLPLLWQGLLVTLLYTVVTICAGMAIGLLVGIAQLSRQRAIRLCGRLYVEFFRNIPLLVLLLWIYYALPIFLHLNMTKEAAGLIGLSCYVGAFYSEIVRGGVLGVDPGQLDAGRALGMSHRQVMRRIVLPQAFRRMVPPLVGQSIIQMKNTTLLSAITVPDLLYQGSYISSFTYKPMEIYTAVGGIFLVILVPLTMLARRMEHGRDLMH